MALVVALWVGQVRRWISSVFRVAKKDSATALSQHWPLRPTDSVTPRSLARLAYWVEVYWQPRSEGNTTPGVGRRRFTASVSASATRSVRRWSATAQPTTRREARSITVA